MVNRAFYFHARSGDFRFESVDPRFQFLDRKRIEILSGQQGHGIVLATRQIFVSVHGAQR